jgi:hypothetical protein
VDVYEVDVDFLVGYARGSTAHLVDRLQLLAGHCPPLQGHLIHALVSAGHTGEASALWPGRQLPARDIMWAMYAGIEADNALALGSADDIQAAYGALSLISGRLAGGESGFFTLGPADTYLARLALRLGRHGDAERHAEAGLRLARSIGNPRWAAHAQEVLASLGAELAVD